MKRSGMLVILLWCWIVCLRAQDPPPKRDTVYQMSPVIVTATQATGRKSPVTFSNLTPQNLRERYSVQDVPVLLSELPSITTYSENGNGIGYNYINIRGFDQRRISVMINGVPQNDPEDHNVYWIDFPDLLSSTENIQVQRGAGSAFYGPPAIGGSVNLVTNPFGGEPGVQLEMMAGFQEFGDSSKPLSLATRKYGASFTSGLVGGQYMFYGRLGKITSDGYRTNAWVDMNSYFFGAIRFDRDMSTRFHFFGGPIQDGLAYNGLGKFVNGNRVLRRQNVAYGWTPNAAGDAYASVQYSRPQEVESFSQPHAELINDWKLSSSLTLHNTLFYYSGDGYFDIDASWADTSMLRIGYRYGLPASANPANALVRAFVGSTQWGWLPRLEIDHGSGELTVGAELRIHRSTHWGKIEYAEGLPAGFDPDYHFYEFNGGKDMFSLYGHELLRLADDMTLMADAQLVRDRYTFTHEKYLGNTFSLPYLFLNPRLGLNYNIDDAWSGYISLAYTSHEPQLTNLYFGESSSYGETPQFKADTIGGVVTYDFSRPLIKPEHLFDAELGARYMSSLFRGSATVYWMEFSNELVKTGQLDLFGEPIMGNANRTRHTGVELEGEVMFAEAFSLSGNLTVSRNRVISAAFFPGGNPIAGFPDVLANARLTYRSTNLTASVMGKYIGGFHTDNFNDEANTTDAAVVFNGEILYRFPRFAGTELTLRGEVRNIFNTLYLAGGEGNTFFPAAERNFLVGLSVHL
jgi:iron complex outermembrane receptor protein